MSGKQRAIPTKVLIASLCIIAMNIFQALGAFFLHLIVDPVRVTELGIGMGVSAASAIGCVIVILIVLDGLPRVTEVRLNQSAV